MENASHASKRLIGKNKKTGSTEAAFQTGCGTALVVPELSTEYLNASFGFIACGLTGIYLILSALFDFISHHRTYLSNITIVKWLKYLGAKVRRNPDNPNTIHTAFHITRVGYFEGFGPNMPYLKGKNLQKFRVFLPPF